MITKKYIPQIRFKGFDEDWAVQSMEGFGSSVGGTSLESEFTTTGKYKVISIGSYSKNSTYTDQGIRVPENEKTRKKILNKNDLAMVLNDKTLAGNIIGRALLIDEDEKYVFNQRTQRLILNQQKYYPKFIYQMLNANNIREKIVKSSQGNTQIYVNWSGVKSLTYSLPNSLQEQTAIGNLFQNIDQTIALQRRQYEQTQTLKKSLLGKMFPQANQSQPDIRLKSFSGDWVEYRLGDIANLINGRAYKQDELLDSGKYPVLRVGNFNTNTHWYYSDLELDDKFYVNQGDLLYTWATIFAPYLWSGNKAIYHYHIWKLDLTCSLDKLFTFHLLKAEEVSLTSNTNGSTMIHVTKGEMENKKIKIPSIEEQKAIGKLLKQLDDTLTLQTKQLKTLENLKKALLAKMFV
ncbi:hypothetical protein FOR85_07975 [Psychrobacter sp. YGAH215]|uniref:restriction endonuclease subunit S n=1 Tax=Psychrobacter sp. YGAH215 TaxID=2596826 RepID=UPI001186A189|nr:restriction endonuclease subunit S [Psychrobacter sp. YGAH215]TSB22928.1 hypothetical protein FOR85_07975 [Psychrobacter sp. YGAH215]